MKDKKIILIMIAVFIAGILFAGLGGIAVKKSIPLLLKVRNKLEQRRIANIPKAKKPLIIADFEKSQDISKWDTAAASMSLSDEHVVSGKKSAKIIYQPAGGAAAVKLEKYLKKDKSMTDWAHYEVLSFDIYNPNSKAERIILQIRDEKGYKIKRDIYLAPNKNNTIEIDIRGLWEKIKPDRIAQFNLFLWNNKSEKVFYLDNVRLLPDAALGKSGIDILDSKYLPKPSEAIYATGDYFSFDKKKWERQDIVTNAAFIEAPLDIDNYLPANLNSFHFSGGVPFGKGELQSFDNVAIYDRDNNSMPFQSKIVSRWPDASIKWGLFDIKTNVSAGEKKALFLRYGRDIGRTTSASSIIVEDNPNEVIINTGPLKLSINKKGFTLFDKAWIDTDSDGRFSEDELISSKGELVLVHKGEEYYSSGDKEYELTIEEKGPVKARLKAKGWFTSKRGRRFCQFIVRITAIEGESYLKLQHTFVYTGYPENKYHYLYKGKRLPRNETIDAIYIKTPFNINNEMKFTYAADNKVMQAVLPDSVTLTQDNHNSYTLTDARKKIASGERLFGWVDASSAQKGLSIGVKNLWQQYPKAFDLDKKNQYIITHIWPKEAGELDFKTTQTAEGPSAVARGSAFGIAKTHDISFYFHKGDFIESEAKEVMNSLCSDIVLLPSPEWVSDTKAIGKVSAFDSRIKSGEEFLENIFDWAARQIENFKWYGMVDFGDTLSWYRKSGFDKSYDSWGWHPEGRHGWFNCEAVGTHSGALIQFLRTGDYKYFSFGANLARHIMDIDTCHYNTVLNDKRLRKQISDDYSRPGSMHRHNGDHWGGRNEEASHTNLYGILLYYYITGDMRARDVLDEVGRFFLDGRITYYKHPDIAPQRTLANVLWGLVQMYELTGDDRYKESADRWARIFYIGQKGDGAWAENYNPVRKRWEGKVGLMFMRQYTLPALIAYHKLTGNKAIEESIIAATDYAIVNTKYSCYFAASAYSFWLTGDERYKDNIVQQFNAAARRQQKKGDPLWDGMIYQKAYYARPMEYLYNMPFSFEVIKSKEK